MGKKFNPYRFPKDAAAGETKTFELFQRVLLEGPRADEFWFQTSSGGIRLRAGGNTPRNTGRRWLHADYVPYKRGYVRPDTSDRWATIPDVTLRSEWHIRVIPHVVIFSYGVWVNNPRLYSRDHLFGLEGMLTVPEGGSEDHPEVLQRHAYQTDDEVVEAAIRCIKGKI